MTDPTRKWTTEEQEARFRELRATVDPEEFQQAFPTLFGDWTIEIHVPKGWRQVVRNACETLAPLGVQIDQVKEKFGGLRLYLASYEGDESLWQRALGVIEAAEAVSRCTCQTCGEPGRLHGPGWYYTACDAHLRQSNRELLDAVDKERAKFTQANEGAMRAFVEELVLRGVYPAGWGSVPKEQWDPYQRMQSWGARWHEWREPLACPHCKGDLRDLVNGPPGKREIGRVERDRVVEWHCPDCKGTWAR